MQLQKVIFLLPSIIIPQPPDCIHPPPPAPASAAYIVVYTEGYTYLWVYCVTPFWRAWAPLKAAWPADGARPTWPPSPCSPSRCQSGLKDKRRLHGGTGSNLHTFLQSELDTTSVFH